MKFLYLRTGFSASRGTFSTQTGRIFRQPTNILASSFACRLSRGTIETPEAGTRTKLRVHSNKATRPLVLWIIFSLPVEPTSERELPRARNDEIRLLEVSVNTCRIMSRVWRTTRIKFTVLIKLVYPNSKDWSDSFGSHFGDTVSYKKFDK